MQWINRNLSPQEAHILVPVKLLQSHPTLCNPAIPRTVAHQASLSMKFPRQEYWKGKVKVAQSCPTLCNPMDYTVHGILQARILEWVAFPFSRGSSQLRDRTQVSHIAGRFLTSWATRDWSGLLFSSPGDLPHPGIEPASPVSPALAGGFFNTEPAGKPMGKNWWS